MGKQFAFFGTTDNCVVKAESQVRRPEKRVERLCHKRESGQLKRGVSTLKERVDLSRWEPRLKREGSCRS